MKESEGKRKEAGTAKRFLPNLLMSKSCLRYSAVGAYILPQPRKIYKKNQNQKLLQGIKWEENQKRNKNQQVKWVVGRISAG